MRRWIIGFAILPAHLALFSGCDPQAGRSAKSLATETETEHIYDGVIGQVLVEGEKERLAWQADLQHYLALSRKGKARLGR